MGSWACTHENNLFFASLKGDFLRLEGTILIVSAMPPLQILHLHCAQSYIINECCDIVD